MKKLLVLIMVALGSISLRAQISTPAPSPLSKVEQKVGLTDISVEYSRPSMRGRTIFGGLEAYGKVWRTGANARTKITFSDDVKIGGKDLKAGSYALYTKPGEQTWEVIFYTEVEGGGTPAQWDENKVAVTTSVNVQTIPMNIETFTITFDDLTNNSANLGLMWEKTYVGIPIEVPTETKVMNSIETTMAASPKAEDYYAAAVYYLDTDKDIVQSKEWMDKAMSMTDAPAFWQLRQKSLIEAKAGNTKEAIKTAKMSLTKAEKAGNEAYVKMNTESLKEWGAK